MFGLEKCGFLNIRYLLLKIDHEKTSQGILLFERSNMFLHTLHFSCCFCIISTVIQTWFHKALPDKTICSLQGCTKKTVVRNNKNKKKTIYCILFSVEWYKLKCGTRFLHVHLIKPHFSRLLLSNSLVGFRPQLTLFLNKIITTNSLFYLNMLCT